MMEMHGAIPPGAHGAPATSSASSANVQPPTPPIRMVSINELPDYQPAFAPGAARADADGKVWVRTSAVRKGVVGGPIYDVIDGGGRLVDRVQLQPGRQIVGFGPHGVVYMSARDDRGAWIERTRLTEMTQLDLTSLNAPRTLQSIVSQCGRCPSLPLVSSSNRLMIVHRDNSHSSSTLGSRLPIR